VLATGWLLGGTLGIGTVLYAVMIGWIVHHALPFFTLATPKPAPAAGWDLTATPLTGRQAKPVGRSFYLGPVGQPAIRRTRALDTQPLTQGPS
jgi:hypothetical protein